jgi:hypothetical protein
MWVIPPEQSGTFVAHMEDILELYHTPYDPQVPMVCMDEQPVQLIQETRTPLPAEHGHPERYDYEYERNGTATIFMFTEPLSGIRTVSVREHKTAIDWATESSVFWIRSIRRRTVSDWSVITSIRLGWARSMRPFPPSRPVRWPRGWRFTIPPSMGVGSISPRSNSVL